MTDKLGIVLVVVALVFLVVLGVDFWAQTQPTEQQLNARFDAEVVMWKDSSQNCGLPKIHLLLPPPGSSRTPVMVFNGEAIKYEEQNDYGVVINQNGQVELQKYGHEIIQRAGGGIDNLITGKWTFNPICY